MIIKDYMHILMKYEDNLYTYVYFNIEHIFNIIPQKKTLLITNIKKKGLKLFLL